MQHDVTFWRNRRHTLVSEKSILIRAQPPRGSTESFAELVRLHQAGVRVCIGRFLRGNELIDDWAQETLVAAFRGVSSFAHDAPFRLWLRGIARHKVLNHLKSPPRRV